MRGRGGGGIRKRGMMGDMLGRDFIEWEEGKRSGRERDEGREGEGMAGWVNYYVYTLNRGFEPGCEVICWM